MRKSMKTRTYAFLLHDLPMKFSPILPFLTRFRKKACGCSATGFTQKRHTLYAYYSRGKSEFQMIFFTSDATFYSILFREDCCDAMPHDNAFSIISTF